MSRLKTSIIGYPRVGAKRELKKWTESYFKGAISKEELLTQAKELRISQLKTLAQKIDFVPCNDFSFYDNMLDTAVMLSVIPKQYKDLGLCEQDTYFAMAKGYQGNGLDVKALAMKKWFNTNYHYIVPVIDDSVKIKLNANKFLQSITEANELNINAKPTVIGPFTFARLTRVAAQGKSIDDYIDDIIAAYKELLEAANENGVELLQIEEPALVTDLSQDDCEKFVNIYNELLQHKGGVMVLLQTYFGDVRDIYKDLIDLEFDAIGLDFVEGIYNIELIEKYGFPSHKILFAGVVNGKNIWRSSYEKSLNIIEQLKNNIPIENVVISTSCSLLHSPYTVESEKRLSAEILNQFAFAYEKLSEISDIATLACKKDYKNNEIYKANVALKQEKIDNKAYIDEGVRAQINALTPADFIRVPELFERKKIQKQALGLPILPTTTIGSFPQTAEVKQNRLKLKKGEITQAEYDDNNKKFIADAVKIQEDLGIDVFVHGEFERNDMVEYFGENLSGFIFTDFAWVQSYGTRCVKPPVIWGDVKRIHPITVETSVYAQSLTKKHMKGMLTGPVTILNWSFPREDISLKDICYQIALAIKDEVLDLERSGIRIIQIDEAALREKLPLRKCDWKDYLDYAINSFRLVHSKVKPETQIHTHMCYSEFGDIIKDIDNLDADVISFEASRSDLTILDALIESNFKTGVGPGVYDIHSPRVPSKEEIEGIIAKIVSKLNPDNIWINPDCGLKTRGWTETLASLKNMVDAAKESREELK